MDDVLYYSVDDMYFQNNDYTYQELFASDVPYYYKSVEGLKIWCNKNTKVIFVGSWYDHLTPIVLNYYLSNRFLFDKEDCPEYISARLNRNTGEIFTLSKDYITKESRVYYGIEIDCEMDDYIFTQTESLVLSKNTMEVILDEINNLIKS